MLLVRRVLVLVAVVGCTDGGGAVEADASLPQVPDPDAGGDKVPDADAGADAQPCTPSYTQILANPGFDEGDVGWTQAGGQLIRDDAVVPDFPMAGPYGLRLIGYNSADHTLEQQVQVPPYTSKLTLRMMRTWCTAAPATSVTDTLTIDLVEPDGTLAERLADVSNLDAPAVCPHWNEWTLEAQAGHPGEALTLRYRAVADATHYTTLYFDSFSLMAHVTCQ